MTEVKWLACDDATKLLNWLTSRPNPPSDRRIRLFMVACARVIWDRIPVGEMRRAVEVAEMFSDAQTTLEELNRFRGQYYAPWMPTATAEQRISITDSQQISISTVAYATVYNPKAMARVQVTAGWRFIVEMTSSHQCPLLRDIIGNPFRPVALDPAWRTTAVLGLADAIYAHRAYDRLPILADALEEAGCTNADLLAHCRGPGPHVRGCGAVDLILGKS
jgi:hypothetical protein